MAIPRNLANFAPKLDSSGNPTFTAPTVFSAGTAPLPSITFTGDTNTGIFSPTADTIAFTEGGTEAMRIDSSGNLGIGTTSPSGKLHAATTTNTSVYAAADSGYSLFRGATNSSGGVLSITGNSTGNGINYTVFNAALNGYEPANYDGSIQVFKTSNTERARIPATGGFQSVNSISVGNATPTTSGAGITFPATQSASTDANTLDDYEEGTWTPVDSSGASLTFAASGGRYVKIGIVVYIALRAQYPVTANGSQAIIGGLPFTAISGNAGNYDMGGGVVSLNSPATSYKGLIDTGGSTIGRINSLQANSDVNVTNANLSNTNLYFWGWYYAGS